MADTFTKADVERLVAESLKLQQAEHLKAIEELKRTAAKTEAQKAAEAQLAGRRGKQLALRNEARRIQGADARALRYVVGPGQAYSNGRHYKPGEIIDKPNLSEVTDPGPLGTDAEQKAFQAYVQSLPSIDYAVYDRGAPAAPPEKKGPISAAEMNKLDAERPKHGVVAPKKGSRPSDTEV